MKSLFKMHLRFILSASALTDVLGRFWRRPIRAGLPPRWRRFHIRLRGQRARRVAASVLGWTYRPDTTAFRQRIPFRRWASFDSPSTTTPQEYAGWGAGLFTEPALKVSFADGNRDLVLHFVKATTNDSHAMEILLKDISREIYVTLALLHGPGERHSGALRKY